MLKTLLTVLNAQEMSMHGHTFNGSHRGPPLRFRTCPCTSNGRVGFVCRRDIFDLETNFIILCIYRGHVAVPAVTDPILAATGGDRMARPVMEAPAGGIVSVEVRVCSAAWLSDHGLSAPPPVDELFFMGCPIWYAEWDESNAGQASNEVDAVVSGIVSAQI